jgi:hypothetical protein
VSRLASLGWVARTNLREGIAAAYQDFLHRPPVCRPQE